jgi:hypothetical protein
MRVSSLFLASTLVCTLFVWADAVQKSESGGTSYRSQSSKGSNSRQSKKDDPNDPWRFANVREWRLSVVIDAQDILEKNSDGTYQRFLVTIGGTLDAKLTRGNVGSKSARFSNGDNTECPSQMTLASKDYRKHTDSQGDVSWTEQNITAAGPVIVGRLSLDIRPDDGTFTLQRFAWMFKSAGLDYKSSSGPSVHKEMPYPLPFNWMSAMAKEMPLPKSGMVLEGRETFDWPSTPFVKGTGGAGRDLKATITWTLKPWEDDAGDPKIEGPKDWLPEDGAQTSVKTTWKGTASEVKFTLYDVSNEKGTCLNSADKNEDPDLGIVEGAGFKVEKVSKDTWTATAKVAGDDFSQLPIACHDYGAWGKVKCEVKINGTWQTAKASSGNGYLTIPKDDNDNHIADQWEKDKDVVGLPETWDVAEVAGQDAKGDGLALYEKYRGVMVDEGGKKVWNRLSPREKVHFVIDPNGLFDFDRWYRTSGIRAYKLTIDMVDGDRRVDFNAGAVDAGGKYASRVERIDGLPGDKESTHYGESHGPMGKRWTPKMCDWIHILPDRIGAMVDRVVEKMRRALNNPTTQEDRDEAQVLEKLGQTLGMSMADLKKAVANFDAAARKARVDQMVALTAIHEVGHACGLLGHLEAFSSDKEDEDNIRNPSCPMQYLDKTLRRRFVLFGELGGGRTFCKVAPDNCWKDLDVKN